MNWESRTRSSQSLYWALSWAPARRSIDTMVRPEAEWLSRVLLRPIRTRVAVNIMLAKSLSGSSARHDPHHVCRNRRCKRRTFCASIRKWPGSIPTLSLALQASVKITNTRQCSIDTIYTTIQHESTAGQNVSSPKACWSRLRSPGHSRERTKSQWIPFRLEWSWGLWWEPYVASCARKCSQGQDDSLFLATGLQCKI